MYETSTIGINNTQIVGNSYLTGITKAIENYKTGTTHFIEFK